MEPTVVSAAVQEYRLLRDDAARIEASSWTVLRLAGPDTAAFLQGLATQDLEHIPEGEASETFFLNEKGRPVALAWVWIAHDGRGAFVLTEEDVRGALAQHLGRFRIMEDVEIEEVAAPKVVLFAGPERDRLLGEDAGGLPGTLALRSTTFAFLLPSSAAVFPTGTPANRSSAPNPATAVAPAAFEAWRLADGIPRAGVDFDLDRIATEMNRPEAISLSKGCYVGQEIVARTSGRGHVRRLRTGFRFAWPGSAPPPRAEISWEGRAAGFLTSSAREPGSSDGLAMGYLSTDVPADAAIAALTPGGSISLRPTPWPL